MSTSQLSFKRLPMTLRLYDLAGAESNRRFSPYCWRIRLALAHKKLAVATIPWRFTEKAAIAASGQGLVPVLVDGDRWVADSWNIATYLEDTYPHAPSLFGGDTGRNLTRHYSSMADGLVSAIFPFIALDIFDRVAEEDRDYFRTTREKRIGMTLEDFVADRQAKLPAFRANLTPLRRTLMAQPFLAGDQPLYADYAVFGPFQWARCISPFALFEQGDPIRLWRDRLLDRFDGLARNAPAYDV
jgi:glutathione S-transferase